MAQYGSRLQRNSAVVAATAAAGVSLLVLGSYTYSFLQRWKKWQAVLSPYKKIMLLDKERMEVIREDFIEQMQAGLEGKESSLLMLPSMVDVLPSGHETGDFFAIDLGGTNYRILWVRLSSEHGGVDGIEIENYPIPEKFFSCPVEELFDLLAKSLVNFASSLGKLSDEVGPLSLGFCFSLPAEQTAIDKGTIARLTKKFTNPGAVGADPVELLRDAISRTGHKFLVRALLNDTVGTMAGGRYGDSNVTVGIIMGTGTNAAYAEKIRNIKKLPGCTSRQPQEEMVVNMEWGGYTSDLLPMTADDVASDAAGANPGQMHFEKLTSGMFMGEAVRRILLNLAENAALFDGHVPEKLRQPWHLTTPDIAAMDEDSSLTLSTVGKRLEQVFDLSPAQCSYAARKQVKYACWLVANRSARLLATAVAGLLRHTGRDDPVVPTTISVDGGVFEHYLAYRKYLATALGWLIGASNVKLVKFNQFRESSSRGAAYLAAAVHHHGCREGEVSMP